MMRGALYWSVRRELWESRSIYLAPILVAAAMLGVAVTFASIHLDEILAKSAAIDPARTVAAAARAFDGVAVALIATSVLVAWFYCLDSLYGERRDRSILFWKSLPVSNVTSVAAKALVPLAILPAVAFAVIMATLLVMVAISSAVLAAKGLPGAGAIWPSVFSAANVGVLAYGLASQALWHAPVFAYLMAVSAAVQRSPLLWAVLPFVGGVLIEKVTLGSHALAAFVRWRLLGGFEASFAMPKAKGAAPEAMQWPIPGEPIPDPVKLLASPGLWAGLAVALALLALAVWLRRRRDPI